MELIVKTFEELSQKELYEILKARAEIFIIEQQVNYQDMDDLDYKSLHFFYQKGKKVIAYLRAFYEGDSKKIVKIGRVLTLEHGKGFGKKLLSDSLPIIQERMHPDFMKMHAQKYAVGFYEKFGFQVTSEEFIEDEILHVEMSYDCKC